MNSPMSVYQVVPLPSNSRTTRFLRIGRNKQGQIVASLEAHYLDDPNLMWTALSYTWNSHGGLEDPADRTILLNGALFPVRINLWKALNAIVDQFNPTDRTRAKQLGDPETYYGFHDPKHSDLFWIDAICVDQQTIYERNHQVLLMKDIYSRASTVIAWLTPSPSCRLDLCDHIGAAEAELIRRELIHNRYWERMWILQEFILPERVGILLGDIRISLDWFQAEMGAYLREQRDCFSIVLHFRQNYGGRTGALIPPRWDRSHLLQMVESFADHKCADPRDKVYALLGLQRDSAVWPIVPDYSKSTISLFIDVVSYTLPHAKWESIEKLATSLNIQSSLPVVYYLAKTSWFLARASNRNGSENRLMSWIQTLIRLSNPLAMSSDLWNDIDFEQFCVLLAVLRHEVYDIRRSLLEHAYEAFESLEKLRESHQLSVDRLLELFKQTPLAKLYGPAGPDWRLLIQSSVTGPNVSYQAFEIPDFDISSSLDENLRLSETPLSSPGRAASTQCVTPEIANVRSSTEASGSKKSAERPRSWRPLMPNWRRPRMLRGSADANC